MEDAIFSELLASTKQALEHAQGKRELRTTVLPDSPRPMSAAEIKKLRSKLKASQAVFAHCLNVSTKLVQAWESDRRHAGGPALVLLRILQEDPTVVIARGSGSSSKTARSGRRIAAGR